jgi:hypothetical protein
LKRRISKYRNKKNVGMVLHDNHKATRFKNIGKLLNRLFVCNIRTQVLEERDTKKKKSFQEVRLLVRNPLKSHHNDQF